MRISQLEIDKIIKVFRATRSVTLTAKKTNRSQTSIRRILKSHGLSDLILNSGTRYYDLAYFEQVNRTNVEVVYPTKPKIVALIKNTD